MTEKQEETCQNCGHLKTDHIDESFFDNRTNFGCVGTEDCSCKKFVGKKPKAKNHSPQDVVNSPHLQGRHPEGIKEGTFNLSKKRELQYIGTIDKDRWIYPEENVKEFISRERGVIDDWVAKLRRNEEGTKIIMVSDLLDLTGRLNKLCGEELSK